MIMMAIMMNMVMMTMIIMALSTRHFHNGFCIHLGHQQLNIPVQGRCDEIGVGRGGGGKLFLLLIIVILLL